MKQTYKIVQSGKHSTRRDYSKVSGNLELPNFPQYQAQRGVLQGRLRIGPRGLRGARAWGTCRGSAARRRGWPRG